MTTYRQMVHAARAECFAMHSGIADSPARTYPDDDCASGKLFGELPDREQLDILGNLCGRSSYWRDVLQEALAESDRVPALIQAALDPTSTSAHLATFLREVLIGYAERVAAKRGDELTEL